jgi:hypothetical protein
MQYQVNVTIDDTGLQNIYSANQYVTLVKSVLSNPMPAGNLPVAWLAFQPLEGNTITWVENYYIYATTTTLQSGATIAMTSQTADPAQLGWIYTFAQGMFTGASGTGDTFNVNNQMSSQGLSFGLAQSATVNNTTTFAPLNAVPVLSNENASFTPEETLSIFLSSYSDNGSVISQVASNALSFSLSSKSPTANIGFNDSTNTFYLMSSDSKAVASPFQFAKSLARRRAA